jgi:hypothetical protein
LFRLLGRPNPDERGGTKKRENDSDVFEIFKKSVIC